MNTTNRTPIQYLGVTLRGLAMGAADVVPGVSGGTIAFITGIYEELINSINQVNVEALRVLRRDGIAAAWKHINGWFFVSLFLGIGVAILSLAKGLEWLLNEEPILIWSFFFGLVFASIFFVGKQVKRWSMGAVGFFILGTAIAYGVSILPQSGDNAELWYIFLSGVIAICAMILPGISGSFILVLLGSYGVILSAANDRDLVILGTFVIGAIIGLLAFSRLLKFMFAKYHDFTIAMMAGFLLGSLNKIWPWKRVDSIMIKHAGEPDEEIVNVIEKTVLPNEFTTPVIEGANVVGQTAADAQLWPAIGLAVAGMAVIFIMEKVGQQKPQDA